MLDGYKTYIIGICYILFGLVSFVIDSYEGNPIIIETYFDKILLGLGLIGLRIGIKKT